MKTFLVEDQKPKPNQRILYVGNLGLKEGTYRNYANGVGWVTLPTGGFDCFDEWQPNTNKL